MIIPGKQIKMRTNDKKSMWLITVMQLMNKPSERIRKLLEECEENGRGGR